MQLARAWCRQPYDVGGWHSMSEPYFLPPDVTLVLSFALVVLFMWIRKVQNRVAVAHIRASQDLHMNPECIEGKHRNCDTDAWCLITDGITDCECTCHPRPINGDPA
jgi:hypothetical protein